MDLETKNNIFYKPDVEIERDYSTDGAIRNELVRQEESPAAQEISSVKLERLKEKTKEGMALPHLFDSKIRIMLSWCYF